MDLNHQTMFSRQSADVINHVFIEVPVGCFCRILLTISDSSTTFIEISYSVALIIGNREFQDTVLQDILTDPLQIIIKVSFIYIRNTHGRIVSVMIYSRFTVTNSKHIAAKHWHEQLSSTFHLTRMGMIVQQDSIIPALFLQNAKLMVRILLSFRNDPVQLVQIRSIYRQII